MGVPCISGGGAGGGAGGGGGGGGGALVHTQVAQLERELSKRKAEHQMDLEALGAAQADAAESHRMLRSAQAWVASLDEMRVADLQTIQRLEAQLQQWRSWHPEGRAQIDRDH